MKKLYLIIKTILLITALLLASACGSGAKRSKDECLQEYFNNIQAARWTSMYQQIHPNNSNYNNFKNGDTFSLIYGGKPTYTISSINGDTYMVNVSDSGLQTFKFEREDTDLFSDGYWSIRSFTNGGTTYQ